MRISATSDVSPKVTRRQGWSLVEVLVALAIIGLLMAILVPAVQSARATARRVECRNNLHQIGVALHNCVTTTSAFPEPDAAPQIKLAQWLHLASNAPLQCPSDAFANAPKGVPSYLFNAGTQFRLFDPPLNGFMEVFRSRRPGEFTDGMSNTAAYSERRLAKLSPLQPDVDAHPDRYLWRTRRDVPRVVGGEALFIDTCRSERTAPTPSTFDIRLAGVGYDHFLTPNQIGCWNGPRTTEWLDTLVPASSDHHGGVNVLFADGHVQFVSDTIDWNVWQALGTVAGNESL
jgi:prepilin-type N-terminal cleavage/methylation domain-containing protein/prepilin-type processing-associated H-X9-DG protein